MPLLLAIAIIVVVALALYAVLLWRRLLRRRRQLAVEAQTAARRRDQAQASIVVLARCVVQDQVSLAEAAIRISALAQGLGQDTDRVLYQPFDDLARAAAHIPIMDGWQSLSRAERNRLALELDELEQRHTAAVTAAAKVLLVRQ